MLYRMVPDSNTVFDSPYSILVSKRFSCRKKEEESRKILLFFKEWLTAAFKDVLMGIPKSDLLGAMHYGCDTCRRSMIFGSIKWPMCITDTSDTKSTSLDNTL